MAEAVMNCGALRDSVAIGFVRGNENGEKIIGGPGIYISGEVKFYCNKLNSMVQF